MVEIYKGICCNIRLDYVMYCENVDYVNLIEKEKCLRDRVVMLLFKKFQRLLLSKKMGIEDNLLMLVGIFKENYFIIILS